MIRWKISLPLRMVIGLGSMSVTGMMPFGSLLGGALAGRIGITDTFIIGGAACLAGAAWFVKSLPTLRKHVRPIYREKGILPSVAKGMESATELTVPPE